MSNNVHDINDMRRIKGIEKGIESFEAQLSDLKKATTLMSKHTQSVYSDRFYNIVCHELVAKQKQVAQELLKLRVRLDKCKSPMKEEDE